MVSILDIIGPSMIGPSSSHTLGAMKIAKFAYNLFGTTPDSVSFYLHGSFKETYIGHGTKLALIAGICGMKTDDPDVAKADRIADELGINYEFKGIDLGDVHPNTVKIVIRKANAFHEVIGSSIGAGRIRIISIDSIMCSVNGDFPALVIENEDVPGALEAIIRIIATNGINIAQVNLNRLSKGSKIASMVIELDDELPPFVLESLKMLNVIRFVTYVKSLN
ncbi:MAG: L-serine ammonia-lyase, iron-sulfur-dependent, subunit beta [Mesoaciditoga sp.]|uniref:L-serine ammonia-lyase, iron-sulfur-dependent subunit beta n=1 Tax=Athalassotoga sp. TaxID=2022597 RepID=UPI000CCA50D1|nr:MAG: L-serine ammonia-lyase, iron-sulfur-dependent, subunit beta [Mesoaciditoga sp.]HEU23643.1 L-serine ammonia-lyase, iron-sulfur-dependent, subunit beta [Mesoaciditoga lauensis]